MTDQIRPSNAAYLWWTPEGWRCELPSKGGSHTILVKDENVASLLAMLKVRHEESLLGEPGDKTQWQIDKDSMDAKVKAFLKANKVKAKPKLALSEETRMNVRDVIRRLGLA